MDQQQRQEIYETAKNWIYEAGEQIREHMNEPLGIETKSNANDLVTVLDKQTEKFFVDRIHQVYPDHHIIGEEGFGDTLTNVDGTVWIIDPIDGTMNFVHQKRTFAISIGILHNGVGEIGFIYDVMGDILYHVKRGEGAFKNDVQLAPLDKEKKLSESIIGMNHFWLCENRLVDYTVMQKFVRTVRGTRSHGSASLELAYIAEGVQDAYLALSLSPWDVAAGIILNQEVGGITGDIDGNPWNPLKRSSILVANPAIHDEIVGFIKEGRK
ncbi:inositol monophosphatase family protein [Oceanobacillus sp. J11TS1]|uniref:inositol monophosphatase family protein n=1 Tax=Oceanobacillus sp. J11TS1 TaxID=2807191 RepID=UPI001B2ACDD8|nr:inositol monophosphatase family protein [Oceanobacillus sp. J11TS1]GIO22341.1 inositol-1-monophosphatase [Oceanobacillus sp. J11TS1]